ncbi:hypothetical protein GCM10011571_19960 [Marinithermofilum abyssi]|uniref:Uncharacterized protein n=1 Tax=Marinithermofilum abyssi TaxID=1571185 RepID=A0A8J2YDL4_9BACL|nr:hypothetical protein [Marinithermofilum abyssi]GGE18149.1 hypothetical protein GCM10011571_19960 [Marinithermofilum abyssi]
MVYFHGIPFVHLAKQFPVLNPGRPQKRKPPSKRKDARHLTERIGFEPVHLLKASPAYPARRCLDECFQYGDTVLVFQDLPFPRVQLSDHEWGVRHLDSRQAIWIMTKRAWGAVWIRRHLPEVSLLYPSR